MQSEGTNTMTPTMGHSPLKVRHSVDLGIERSKLLSEEGLFTPHEVKLTIQ